MARAARVLPAMTFGMRFARPWGRSIVTAEGRSQVNRIRTATVAALLAAFVGLQAVPVGAADDDQRRHRRDRYEDKRDRHERRARRRDHRDYKWDHYRAPRSYWDPARYYRRDYRYRPRRLGRHDRIYRGSDNRYYCRRDDGTAGLIVGGVAGGVLGNIIAPGQSKTIGTIIGAGAGALIGRAIDEGNIICE